MSLQKHAPHVAKAYEYAEQVCSGKILAAKLTRLACKRFSDDLNREHAPCR